MKVDLDVVEKTIDSMSASELSDAVRQYFAAGENFPDRDAEINRRIAKAYKKRAEKLLAKAQKSAK